MNASRPPGIPLRPDRAEYERERRRSLTRVITAMALTRAGDAAELLHHAWPHDDMADRLLKAAQSPTSTGSYPSITTATTLPALAPESAAIRLFASCMQVSLAGVARVRIPNVATAPQPGFILEGAPAPVAQFSLAGVDLGPACKLLIQAAVTGELDAATPEAASAVIGRALATATAKSLDAAVFSTTAADATRPAGLLVGVTPITAASAAGNTTSLEVAAADISGLATAIAAAGIDPTNMVIVAAWKQATKLQLLSGPNFGHVIIGTNALAAGSVVGIAPAGVASGYSGVPEIETSTETLLHMESTTPLPIATGAQGSGVLATPTQSAFQTNMIVIKVRARCAWAALPGSVQIVNSVVW